MLGNKTKNLDESEPMKTKPAPAFLQPDYPYQAAEEDCTDFNMMEEGVLYEIKCHQCEMSIRSRGKNIRSAYERSKKNGCIGCGNKELLLRRVNMTDGTKSG